MAYSDEQKALALATLDSCRGNSRAAAKFCKEHYGLNVTSQAIDNWAKGKHLHIGNKEILAEKKENLADVFESVARALLGSISAEDIAAAKLSERMTGAGIATDKMQLLREKPTAITGQYADPNERRARIAELLDRSGMGRTANPTRDREQGESATIN